MCQRLLRVAKELMQAIEPSGPWHPEVYAWRRKQAIGDGDEEALEGAPWR